MPEVVLSCRLVSLLCPSIGHSQVGRVEVRNATAMVSVGAMLRGDDPFNATYFIILDFYNGISPSRGRGVDCPPLITDMLNIEVDSSNVPPTPARIPSSFTLSYQHPSVLIPLYSVLAR